MLKAAAESRTPTYWAILCDTHGQVFLTREEYNRQLCRPDDRWRCPRCGEVSGWDDDNYERSLNDES